MQFVERVPWVPQFNIQYLVGVDGLSLFLVLLTTLAHGARAALLLGRDRASGCKLVPVPDAAARSRHDRRLRVARPGALLRLLGADADPDVLPDRRLGRSARHLHLPRPDRAVAGLRRGQVLHLHHGRQRADAGRHPGALLPGRHTSTCWSCRRCSLAPNLQIWLFLAFAPGLRHQGAALPVPHLAARCARGGADRRLGDPGRASS